MPVDFGQSAFMMEDFLQSWCSQSVGIRGNTVDLIRLSFDPLQLDYLTIRRQVTT